MAYNYEYPYTDPNRYNSDWIINTVKEFVKKVENLNMSFEELTVYVKDYFKNIDVSDEISNKLEEMYNDGRLAELINTLIEKKNLNTFELYSYFYSMFCPNINWTAQGGCMIDDDVLVQCFTADNENGDVLVQKIDADTGSVLQSSNVFGRHANSICYVPYRNELWINHFYNSNESGLVQSLYSNGITVLDATTLEQKRVLYIEALESVGIVSLSFDNDNLYIASHDLGNGNKLFIYNIEYGTLTPVENVNIYPTVNQFVTVIDNYIYALNDLTVRIMDMQGNDVMIRQLPYVSNDFCTAITEVEYFAKWNDRIYVGVSNNRYKRQKVQYRIVLDTLHRGYRYFGSSINHFPTASTSIKVDNTYRPYQDGTRERPFDCVMSAIRIGSCLPVVNQILGVNDTVFDEAIILYDDIWLHNVTVTAIDVKSKAYLQNVTVTGNIDVYWASIVGINLPKRGNYIDSVVIENGASALMIGCDVTSNKTDCYPVRVNPNGNVGLITESTFHSTNDTHIYYYGCPSKYVQGVITEHIASSINKSYVVQ